MDGQQTDRDSTDAARRRETCCGSVGRSLTERAVATDVQQLATLGTDTASAGNSVGGCRTVVGARRVLRQDSPIDLTTTDSVAHTD